MGDELVKDNSSSDIAYSEQIDKYLPHYLSIGMTYEQYMDGPCDLTVAYRKAEKERQSRRNFESWLAGKYVYDALCAASPLFLDFVKPGTTAHDYTEEPYPLTKEEVEARQIREIKKNAAGFSAYVDALNKKIRKKKEVNGDG